MHLAHLRLRDFRNYARLDVDFAPGFHLLLGDNAQGKTNILEAIYLMATLRSFRGVGGAQMIRHGAKGYFVGGNVVGQGDHEIKMYWALRERKLSLDGQPVKKLADYLGALRTVVFCTEDLQLVKGTARARRRFLDLLLAQTQDLASRHVIIVTDSDPAAASPLRLLLRPHGFALVLLDTDGRVALRKPEPWDVRELTRVIDKMPSRLREIGR